MQTRMVKLHHERFDPTSNGVRVPPRRLTIFCRKITFANYAHILRRSHLKFKGHDVGSALNVLMYRLPAWLIAPPGGNRKYAKIR